MARRTVTILSCDLCDDGADDPNAVTVAFSYSGRDYELDLCAAHAEEVRATLSGWARRGHRAGEAPPAPSPARTGRRRSGAHTDREQLDAIRRWARDNGFQVTERGRIPERIMDAFQAAHGTPARAG